MSRLAPLLLTGLLLGLGAGCGPDTGPRAEPDPLPTSDAGDLLWGFATVLQQDQEPVQLCLGGVMASYPPQCSGLELAGFSWDDTEHESAAGVRWTSGVAVGRLVGERFVLDEPLRSDPPPAASPPPEPELDFPLLCEDPYRGGDPAGDADEAAHQRLLEEVEGLPGYVTSWVSDGGPTTNVIVAVDAEGAHQRLRAGWQGGLCVVQRDLPTQADSAAAQVALHEHLPEVLSSAGGGVDGRLAVDVVVADEATLARVHETVAPWLSPEQVAVTGALQRL